MNRTQLTWRNHPAESQPGKVRERDRDRTKRVKRGRERKQIQTHQINYRKYISKLYRNENIAWKNNLDSNSLERCHQQTLGPPEEVHAA